jgi:transcriptional regulator with XRE-family HTH domain
VDKKQVFGLFIGQHRVARGLSQTALAKAVGISRPYLSQIEGGKRLPNDETFMALLFALGASMEEFVRSSFGDDVPQEKIDAMADLVRGVDELSKQLPPEAMMAFMQAQPSLEQMGASLAVLGDIPLPPGPDGWLDLSAEDRRLVQRLINRLLKSGQDARAVNDGDE